MPYGSIKVDNIVFTNSGVDQTVTVSGLVQSVSGNLTVTGTISGNLIRGTTVSGATITGSVLSVTSGLFASGTAAAPSIGFAADNNTGFWSPAGDTLALSTGGSERLRVDSDGDLGVGTTSPTSRLTVRADAASGPNTIIRVENRAVSAGATTQNIKIEGIFDYNNGTSDASAGAIVYGKEGTYTTATANNDSYLAFETVTDNSSTEKVRINSTGQLFTTISGTAALPAISVGSDLNTGLYSPGADQVAISTGGTGRLFVDASGNVGVGTTLAVAPNSGGSLTANGTLSVRGYLGDHQASAGVFEYNNNVLALRSYGATAGTGAIAFNTGGGGNSTDTERLRITSAGLVGIGTALPSNTAGFSQQLELAGSLPCISINQTNAGFTTRKYSFGVDSLGSLGIWDNNASAYRFYVNTSGLVGIGTSSPSELLELSATADPKIRFVDVGNVDGKIGISSSTALTFEFNSSERLRITSTGNVGIGTSSPSATLQLGPDANGSTGYTFKVQTPGTPASTSYFQVSGAYSSLISSIYLDAQGEPSGGGYEGNFVFRTSLGNTGAAERLRISGGGTTTLTAVTGSSPFIAKINTSEVARIDSSGRLLVGTSTSQGKFYNSTGVDHIIQSESAVYGQSWIANGGTAASYGLHLTVGRSRGVTAGSTTLVAADDLIGHLSFQGADGTEFVEAARIESKVDGTPGANDMPGRLVFYTTADGAALPTEAMRINNQQELLIGTTTRTANGGVLQISNGITFPGTQSACSDANTLDDYEEGTFTPTLIGTSVAGTGTYTTQVGRYTKIGNRVQFTFYITWTAHTGTGNLRGSGLPFTSNATTNNFNAITVYHSNVAMTAGNTMQTYVVPGNTQIAIAQVPTGGGGASSVPIDTAGEIMLTGLYEV